MKILAAFLFTMLNPMLLVNTLVGTSGTPIGGPVDTFPGADVPFGMVQWSPDTPSQNAGGGYEYGDRAITGFSLTHVSGPGCSVFGDFGILPTTGAIANPAKAQQPFSHADEESAPGWYAVTLGNPAIRSELSVTTRTGLGRFTFPAATQANLLFNVSSDQAGVNDASIRITGPAELEGSASSGAFCGMPDAFKVYFVAQFDRPFASHGTWKGTQVALGSDAQTGAGAGGWVTFDTSQTPAVKVKVGLSFVSTAGARANLRAESRGWDVIAVRNDALRRWQSMFNRIAVDGGTYAEQRIFYTALYHALLHPNVFSDVTGEYPGYDGTIHRAAAGHAEFANYSDWDIYRTQIPLVALIAPRQAGDMMQSLVDAAHQGGFLPRWALVNAPTSVMGGDSVDPVIAGAYAFGARDFDVHGALAAMVKGASDTHALPEDGWYVERPELADYLSRGYIVNTHTTSVSPVPNGASETLEYALDDFSIAQFARNIGAASTYNDYLERSSNWAKLFDTATGSIAPRNADGEFMQTPITSNGQSGFQEGNAAQYTWMVPQDLHDLIRGMGGKAAAIKQLDTFFSQLNADQDKPYAWLGNEPSLGSPWVYLSAGQPWREQQIVRQVMTTLYADTPEGIPGNDDLGTMSAWYVWCAMGLYPQNPSVRGFDIGAPLFTHVVVRAPNGPTIRIDAPQASDGIPYVQSLQVNGKAAQRTWIALPEHGTLHLAFALGASPNTNWGTAPQDAPPSYAARPVHFPVATAATLTDPALSVSIEPGGSAVLPFGVSNARGAAPVNVQWHAQLPAGIAMQPASGTVAAAAGGTASVSARLTASSTAVPGLYDIPIVAQGSDGAQLEHLTAVVRVARRGQTLPLAYIENQGDNTVTPFDLATNAVGAPIAVKDGPRDATIAPDGKRLYVADRFAQSVSVIDTASQTLIANIKVGQSPSGIAVTPDGKTVWLANYDDSTLQSIDTASLKPSPPIAVGTNPRDIAIAPDGKTLYVTNQGANTVTPVDLATRTVQPAIPVGSHPLGIAFTPDGKVLYVSNHGSNDVTPIDVASRRALAPIKVGIGPQMLAASPDGKLLYVTNAASTTVTPIDLTTNTARAPIVVGGAPYGVTFGRDGKTAYIINRQDNDCVTIDVAAGRVTNTIPLGNVPLTIAMP
ncbi:MAG: GH92 family glycosyl hydrolase [Vulcanimicrobiaceae bacterium]